MKFLRVILLIGSTMLVPTSLASAHQSPEQSFTGPINQSLNINAFQLAQEFTPTVSNLVAVDILLDEPTRPIGQTGTITVIIKSGDGTELGSTSQLVTTIGGSFANPHTVHFDFAAPVILTPEQTHLIEVQSAELLFNWGAQAAFTDPYTRGRAIVDGNPEPALGRPEPTRDFGFTTYSEEPPPPPCTETIAFVTERDAGRLSAVDLASGNIPFLIGPPRLSKPRGVTLNAAESNVFMTDLDTGQIAIFDFATGVLSQLSFGLTTPVGLALNDDEDTLFVTDRDTGGLSAVDPLTRATTPVTSSLSGPRNVVLNAAEDTAFVTEADRLVAVNLTAGPTFGAIMPIAEGLDMADGLAINAAETTAFVTQVASGELSAIDLTAGPTFGTVSTITTNLTTPVGLALSSDETTVFVVERDSGELSAVDVTPDGMGGVTLIAAGLTTPVGVALGCGAGTIQIPLRWCAVDRAPSIDNPGQVLESSTDDVLVRRHERVNDNIFLHQSRIAFRSGATVDLPHLPIIPDPDTSIGLPGDVFFLTDLSGPKDVALNTAETKLFVNESNTGELSEFDLTMRTITTKASGLRSPSGLALFAGGSKALVTENVSRLLGGQLSEVDLDSGMVRTVVPADLSLGFGLGGVALNAAETKAYVAEGESGKLSEIVLATGSIRVIASGLSSPFGVALKAPESPVEDETHAFVTERGSPGKLSEVELLTGNVREITSALRFPGDLALIAGETKALVADFTELVEVDLESGMITTKASSLNGVASTLAVNNAETKAFVLEVQTREISEVDLTTTTPPNVTNLFTPTMDYNESQRLTNACRTVWEAGDPTVTGIPAVHIRLFVDADGDPIGTIGLALGGAIVIDNAFLLPCTQQPTSSCLAVNNDPVDKLLGHELGHELGLGHGNGLDDDGDGQIDEPGELEPPGDRNLMESNLPAIEITTAQSLIMRGVAQSIPDAEVNPSPLTLASSRTDPLGDVPAGQEFIDIDSFGVSQHKGITTLSLSVAGLFPESIADLKYFFVADLDDDPSTGGSPPGVPSSFAGAELAGSVRVDVSEGIATATPTVLKFQASSSSFVTVVDPSIQARVLTRRVRFQGLPLPGALTEDDVGQEIRLEFANAVSGPLANDIRLEAIAEGPGGSDTASASLTFRKPLFASCTADPPSTPTATQVTVTAQGLPPFGIGEVFLGTDLVADGAIDGVGRASFSFDIPIDSPGGTRSVTVHVVDTAITADCAVTVEAASVGIDIKPGKLPNSVSLNDRGNLPVAILGSAELDVTTIDPDTIELGGVKPATRGSARNPKPAISYKDVNSDGDTDLIAFFRVQDLVDAGVLSPTTARMTLGAKIVDGGPLEGTDSVNVVP